MFESPTGAADSRGFSSAYRNTRGTQVYFARGPFSVDAAQSRSLGYLSIVRLDSTIPTGDGGFTLLTSPAVLAGGTGDSGCPFCTAIDTPVVIPDPDPSLTGGGPNASLMYFAALQQVTDFANNTTYQVAVVRASSPDGESFVVDASPLLKSTAEEQVLYSPRVIVDGTTYKMFYSLGTEAESILDPCSALATFRVGYATSSDGYFWVRSPRNSSRKTKAIPNPPPAVFDVNTMPGQWDTGRSIQVGSVLPVDGVDPASGLVLYYTAYERQLTGACMPNGVGRAIRR